MTNQVPPAKDDGWAMSDRRERAVMFDSPSDPMPEADASPFDAEASNVRLPTGRGVLSAEEVAALLRPNLDDMPPLEPEPEKVVDKAVQDFPDAPTRTAQVEVGDVEQQHARRLAARLSLSLRQDCGLKAAATVSNVRNEEFAYALEGAGRGVAVACFTAPSGEIGCMLMLSAPLTSALIETACGGKPSQSPGAARVLTPLDAALLEGLVRPLGGAVGGHLSFARVEIDAAFAAALASPGTARVIDLDVRVEEVRLSATLILAQDDLFEEDGQGAGRQIREPALFEGASSGAVTAQPNQKALTAVLTARIAKITVPLSRLSNLKPGATLLLGVPADQPVALLSGGLDGALAAEGEIGRKGGKIAIRVTRRGPALR